MQDVPDALSESVRARILRDMRPSRREIYLKSATAATLGAATSLLMAGLFAPAEPSPFRLAASGAAFAVIPPLVLRVLCSPIQFRVILARGRHAPTIWFLGLLAVLAHQGGMTLGVVGLALWSSATAGVFSAVCLLIDSPRGATSGVG